jgi:hypothetical protein
MVPEKGNKKTLRVFDSVLSGRNQAPRIAGGC